MRRIFPLPGWLQAALGQPVAQLAQGRRLSAKGRYSHAVRHYTRAARSGLPEASFELGRAYLLGCGLPASPNAAVHWLGRAALGGEVEAQLMLATLALQGVVEAPEGEGLFAAPANTATGVPNYPRALHWTNMAVAAGSAPAKALLGFILTAGPPELRDTDKGDDCYRQAAEGGSAHGQLGWAIALLRSSSPAAIREAHKLLTAAAEKNLPAALCMLGIMADSGVGGTVDLASAAQHFQRAAEMGHGPSQLRYGLAFLHGRGVPRDAFAGETWLRRAALTGEPAAAVTLGQLYSQSSGQDGNDLPPNHAEAMLWFRRAAEAGHGGAARALAHRYLYGVGIGADPREAIRWLRMAVSNDDLHARVDLAGMALMPEASEQDRAHALALFREVAEAGDMAAAYNVGLCYAGGIGTARDDEQALAWFRRAAPTLPIAQYWCARMLGEGRGAPHDLVAAREGFLAAAQQGFADAQAAAGEMLANGRGGPVDISGAKLLFTRAAATGHAGALFALGLLSQGACGEPADRATAVGFLRLAAGQGHQRARAMLADQQPKDQAA
jgi:TPR repeat protein